MVVINGHALVLLISRFLNKDYASLVNLDVRFVLHLNFVNFVHLGITFTRVGVIWITVLGIYSL